MVTVLVRTVIVYIVLISTMRFMGKRQLGELEISDLVTTLLLSDIATLPITNTDIPLSHALVPILTLTSLEVILSGALLKIPFLKKLLSVRPAILVRHGEPDRAVMRSMRISAEELMSQLRQKDVTHLDEVEYAILEPNGQISVVKSAVHQEVTPDDLGIDKPETGMTHLIICDGKINPLNLSIAGKDGCWLKTELRRHKLTEEEVFLLTVDDAGEVRVYPRNAS